MWLFRQRFSGNFVKKIQNAKTMKVIAKVESHPLDLTLSGTSKDLPHGDFRKSPIGDLGDLADFCNYLNDCLLHTRAQII